MEFLIFLNRFSTMKDRGEAAALIAVWRLWPPMLVTDHPRPRLCENTNEFDNLEVTL
jgi:hypothetical protein